MSEMARNLKDIIEKEIELKAYLVEQFILENRVDSGKIILDILGEDYNLSSKSLAILNNQALPYIPDDYYMKVLETILEHKNSTDRLNYFIIQKIGWRGKYAKELIPKVVHILKRNSFLKRICSIALAEMDYEDTDTFIPYLLEALANERDRINRLSAARQLLKYVDTHEQVIPALVTAMNTDKEFQVRQKIVHYLGELKRKELLSVIKNVKNNDPHTIVRSVAMRVFEELSDL